MLNTYEELVQMMSANVSNRDGRPIELLVMHCSAGGNGKKNAEWMQQRSTGKSYHATVDRHGVGRQLVPFNLKAWHAGFSACVRPSTGEVEDDLNDWSIGICLDNWGLLHRKRDGTFWTQLAGNLYRYTREEPVYGRLEYEDGRVTEGYWEPYKEAQIQAAVSLCERLYREGWVKAMVGHEEVATPLGRRSDPGPVFPWERFEAVMPRLHPAKVLEFSGLASIGSGESQG